MRRSRLMNTIHHYDYGVEPWFLWGYEPGSGGGQKAFPPDSPEWYAWLSSLTSFYYSYADGKRHFTARREKRRPDGTGGYWYAYIKQHGRLFKRYLGKSEELTLAHLEEAASALYEEVLSYLPESLAIRGSARQQPNMEALSLGQVTVEWSNGALSVKTDSEVHFLSKRQTAELLSYLYERRRSILP